jgi:tetratricopeptide (TPR) repeat protein
MQHARVFQLRNSGAYVLQTAPAVLAALLAALLCANPSAGAKKEYSFETNPIRLGTKALEDGNVPQAKAFFEEAIANEHEIPQAQYGLAEVYVRQGNYGEAEPLYRKAIAGAQAGTLPQAHAGLGLLLLRAGRIDEARLEIDTAMKEKKDLWEAQYAKALLAIHDKRFDEAKDLLEEGDDKKGAKEGEDKYHHGMAKLAFEQGDLEKAESEALLAMTQNTSEGEYATLVADIYVKRGSPALAIQTYEKVLATPGASPSAPFYYTLGTLFEKIQEPNQALQRYQEAVKIDSTYAPALREMGRLYALGKVHDKAALAYGRYVEIAPHDMDALVQLAKSSLEARAFKSAHEAAKRAYAMDSTRADVRLLLARSAYQDKDKETATRLYASAVDTTLYEAIDYIRLGQIAFEEKRFEQARQHLSRGVAMDTTNVEGYFTLGILELNQNNPEGAVTALQKATELAPTFSPAPLNLGIALLQAKRPQEGIAVLRQAQTLAPENPQVLISLAQALVSADSVAAAITEYRRALDIEPDNTKALRGLGYCQLKRQSYGEAVTALKEATSVDPGNADGWAMLGQAYLGLNDVLHAKQAAEKSLAINPSHPTGRSVLEVSSRAQSGKAGQ